jgi:hypothetical protein
MWKSVFLMLCLTAFTGFNAVDTHGQTQRKSVSAAEVTGTFRYTFPGKFKGSSSDIKILALGRGKLKIGFDLVYPYAYDKGELMSNVGQVEGTADIEGDTAVYSAKEFGSCKITIKFLRPGVIKVSQQETDAGCGFGHNVRADGTYRKVSSKKPKFDQEDKL